MMFIDGENLAIRYAELLTEGKPTQDHVKLEKDVFVWTSYANVRHHERCEVVRRHYYTAVQGDSPRLEEIEDRLKEVGIEAPRVFKKQKGRRSKRVDLSLASEMLGHAHRRNYEIAILVGGDDDYVPLVDAVMSEGRRVVLWALPSGLSETLARRCDHAFDIGTLLFGYAPDIGVRFR